MAVKKKVNGENVPYSTMFVLCGLISEGLNHTEDIVGLVFNYIGLLKRTGALAWVQEELAELGELKFRFLVSDGYFFNNISFTSRFALLESYQRQDKENPMSLATKVSSELKRVPFEDILSWRYLLPEFKPGLLSVIPPPPPLPDFISTFRSNYGDRRYANPSEYVLYGGCEEVFRSGRKYRRAGIRHGNASNRYRQGVCIENACYAI